MQRGAPARGRLRERDPQRHARREALAAVLREADELRQSLAAAELEIAGIWESDLPWPNKLLLVQILRSRCRPMETRLARLHAEAAAAVPRPRPSSRRQ